MAFWREVFETHRKIMGTSSKPKSDSQIRKWLEDPIPIRRNTVCGEWMRLTERVFRALRHCVLCTVPGLFIVTFILTFQLLLFPFRVINVIPKGKQDAVGLTHRWRWQS